MELDNNIFQMEQRGPIGQSTQSFRDNHRKVKKNEWLGQLAIGQKNNA